MPKFRKPPRNSYYFFMVDRKKEMEAQGRRFPRGMQDVAAAVAGEWKLLTKEQKEKYEDLAKVAKQQEKFNLNNKFTCSGESYATLNKRLEDEQMKMLEDQAYLESLIRCEDPVSQTYVLMHAIPCCSVELRTSFEKEYWPLEFCTVAFTMKHGVLSHYWSLVDTVRVPTGYLSEAKEISLETLLPVPGSQKFRDCYKSGVEYGAILWTLRTFVEQFCKSYPNNCIIFGMPENLPAIKGTIKWLVNNVPENMEDNRKFLDRLTFMSLPDLVLRLSTFASELNPDYVTELTQLQLVDSAISLLSWTHLDYRNEITCLYHVQEEHCENMQICSSNYILRRAFIILQEIGVGGFGCLMTDRHELETFRDPTSTLPPELAACIEARNQPPPIFSSRPDTEAACKFEMNLKGTKENRRDQMYAQKKKRRYDPVDEWHYDQYYSEDVKFNKKPRIGPNESSIGLVQASLTGSGSVLSEIAIGHSVPVELDITEDDPASMEPEVKLSAEDFPVLEDQPVSKGRGVRRIIEGNAPFPKDIECRGVFNASEPMLKGRGVRRIIEGNAPFPKDLEGPGGFNNADLPPSRGRGRGYRPRN